DLRDADTGHDTGRADRPGPHADLHGIDPALDERARARFGRDVAGDELRVGEGVAQTRHGVQHALAVAMRRVHDDHVAAGVEQRLGAGLRVLRAAYGGGDTQPSVLVLVGVRILAPLEDVFDGDEAAEQALLVYDGELLDAMPGENAFRLVQVSADRGGHELVLRHDVTNRPVQLTLELQVSIG